MSRRVVTVAAAAAALLAASALPAVAGGWGYDEYEFSPPSVGYGYGHGYGYGYRPYGVASVPVVTYGLVPVPIVAPQPVLIVNQGPTFVPTSVNYITPTVTYEPPRVFPYGSSGYGYRRHHHHHHRRHVHYRSYDAPRYHSRGYRDPGYK